MKKKRYQILLTNDDGIQSPGLWAAAEVLSQIGYVWVAAPREQATSMGRSMPPSSDGKITPVTLRIGEQDWLAHAVGGTPAQSVLHAVLELLPEKPDLVVSGINYGENVGTGVTISGTVMAAVEAASLGLPALAVSAQILDHKYYTYSDLDFSAAAYFTRVIAEKMLGCQFPPDVKVIKVDVPYGSTPETPWRVTRQAQHNYYRPVVLRNGAMEDPSTLDVFVDVKPGEVSVDSDIHALLFDKVVSVTPLSLDMTSRVSLADLEKQLKSV